MAGLLQLSSPASGNICPRRSGGRNEMRAAIQNFIAHEAGADLIEYALLAGLVALAAVATLTTVGTNISGLYSRISTKVAGITIP